MPGPGKNKQKKKKSTSASTSSTPVSVDPELTFRLPNSYVSDIEDAVGWTAAADIICMKLDIPDLETRSGLKRVHRDFSSIYKRLDDLYNQFYTVDRIAGGVIGIYTKMSSDSILRNRLFHEKDLLSKLIKLLDRPSLTTLSLQCLCTVTHHGGLDIRVAIAKKTAALLRLLEEEPDNAKYAELAIVVLSHSSWSAIGCEEVPDPSLVKAIDVPRLVRVFIAQIRKPSASSLLIDHAMGCLSYLTFHCHKEFSKVPSAVNFLVACLRSSDIQNRGIGMGGLIRLHCKSSDEEVYTSDPQKVLRNIRNVPKHLLDPITSTCGPQDSEMFRMVTTTHAFTNAMTTFAQDHRNRDFVKLGQDLAKFILTSEHSISFGCFQVQDPRTGELEAQDLGLGFTWWQDSLPLCAKALRAKGTPEMLDMADILELKYMVISKKTSEAQPLAKRAIERNPRVGFFYYVRSLSSDEAEALRCAKKGLKCPNLTTYVKNALLYRGCEHAINMGISILGDSHTGDQRWHEGIAFLMSAYEDACAYVEGAPPDSRFMKNVMYLHSVLTMGIKGGEIGIDLKPLRDMDERVKLSEEYARFLGAEVPDIQFRQVRRTIMARMEAACKEWDDIIANFPYSKSRKDVSEVTPEKAEDDFSAWLENMNLEEDGDKHFAVTRQHMKKTHPKVNLSDVDLYRCSWCKNPSAVLRKCSTCESARYCDGTCQKEHWKTHKKSCLRKA